MDLESIPPITGAWGALTLAVAVLEHTLPSLSFQLSSTRPPSSFANTNLATAHNLPLLLVRWGSISSFTSSSSCGTRACWKKTALVCRSGGRAAYVTLLAFAAICLLILSPLTTQPFLDRHCVCAGIHLVEENRHVRLSLFGCWW